MGNAFRKLGRRMGCDHRRQFSRQKAWKVYQKCEGLCFYCDKSVIPFDHRLHRWEIDHVYPRSQGGTDSLSNLVVACYTCNRLKKDISLQKFCVTNHLLPRCRKLIRGQKTECYCWRRVSSINTKYCDDHNPPCCVPCCAAPD